MNINAKRAKSLIHFIQALEKLEIAEDNFLYPIIRAAIKREI